MLSLCKQRRVAAHYFVSNLVRELSVSSSKIEKNLGFSLVLYFYFFTGKRFRVTNS